MTEVAGRDVTPLRDLFVAAVGVMAETLAPGKTCWVSVAAGDWTYREAAAAVQGVTAPDGFTVEVEHGGFPEVWIRDLEQGRFYSIFMRRNAVEVTL